MTKANVVQSSAMRNAIIVGAEAGFFTRFSTPPSPSHCPRKFLARAGLFLPIGLGVAAISDDWKRGERERERERERGGVDRSGDWRVTQCREMSWHSPRPTDHDRPHSSWLKILCILRITIAVQGHTWLAGWLRMRSEGSAEPPSKPNIASSEAA